MADLLATDCILLVIERKRSFRHGVDVQVIQRGVRGGIQAASNGERNVTEAEGLRAAFATGVEVFGGSEEPEEANDAEINGMLVGLTSGWVVGVKDVVEVFNDGDVGGVGASAG